MDKPSTSDSCNGPEPVEYHPESDSYAAEFVDTSTPPSRATLDVMAVILDAEYVELDPLYDYVDPSALDAICTGREETVPCKVQFSYMNCRVTVERSGYIEVEPISAEVAESGG